VFGVLIGACWWPCGLYRFHPGQRVFYAIAGVLAASVVRATNLGGFFVGMLPA